MQLRKLRRIQLARSFHDAETQYYSRWWYRNGGINLNQLDVSQLAQSDPDYKGTVMTGEIGTLFGFTIVSDSYRPA